MSDVSMLLYNTLAALCLADFFPTHLKVYQCWCYQKNHNEKHLQFV